MWHPNCSPNFLEEPEINVLFVICIIIFNDFRGELLLRSLCHKRGAEHLILLVEVGVSRHEFFLLNGVEDEWVEKRIDQFIRVLFNNLRQVVEAIDLPMRTM